jgi:hypothetical protein
VIDATKATEAEEVAYPGIYYAADAAARRLQRRHFVTEAAQLALNPIAATLVVLAAARLLPLQNVVLTAFSTTIIVIAMWVARASRWEKLWYDCRGAAEDLKGLAWRYMAGLEPFPHGSATVDVAFVRAIDDTLRNRPDIRTALGHEARSISAPISPEMRALRACEREHCAELYLEERLRRELRWYAAKARRYAVADNAWFVVLFLVQLAAVVYSIWLAVRLSANPSASIGIEGILPVITALGGAAMGWTRSKRFADLCSSYTATAQALAGLESTRPHPTDAEPLRAWMASVETVLAREHEVWRKS